MPDAIPNRAAGAKIVFPVALNEAPSVNNKKSDDFVFPLALLLSKLL